MRGAWVSDLVSGERITPNCARQSVWSNPLSTRLNVNVCVRGAGVALQGGAEGGARMGIREGISVCTQPGGRALPVSPRYQIGHKASRNRGALSYFFPVSGPLAERFICGIYAMNGPRRARPLVPVNLGGVSLISVKVLSLRSMECASPVPRISLAGRGPLPWETCGPMQPAAVELSVRIWPRG